MATVPLPHALTSTLDAVEVVFHLLDIEPDTTLAALVDHLPGGDQVVVSIDGGDPGPAGAEAVATWLGDELADAAGARFVVVSVRHRVDATVAEADLATWRQLCRTHRRGPLVLLDWLVVTDDAFTSMAELSGPPPPWGR